MAPESRQDALFPPSRERPVPLENPSASVPDWAALVAGAIVLFVGLELYLRTAPVAPNSWLAGADAVARFVARGAKWMLPFLCVMAAIQPALSQHAKRQHALYRRVAADASPDALEKFDWADFEGLVAEVFRQKGYRVVQRGGAQADGGVDLDVYFGSNRYFVQCKQWKARQVGVSVVRELFGVVAAEGAAGGFVVTSGSFTQDAIAFAKGRPLILVDAQQLRKQIGGEQATFSLTGDATPGLAPACPLCKSTMVARPAQRGPNAGGRFWGCSRYPKCRGTRA